MRMNRIITGLLYFILTLGALGAFRAVWHTGFTVLWIWVVCVLAALLLGGVISWKVWKGWRGGLLVPGVVVLFGGLLLLNTLDCPEWGRALLSGVMLLALWCSYDALGLFEEDGRGLRRYPLPLALALLSWALLGRLFGAEVFGTAVFALSGLLAGLLVVSFLPLAWLRFLIFLASHTIYHGEILHAERIPARGGALLLANHVSPLDALMILCCTPRHVQFMVYESFFASPVLRLLFGLLDVWKVPGPGRAKEMWHLREKIRSVLKNGGLVAIFPEGKVSPNGITQTFRGTVDGLLGPVDVPVIPIRLGLLHGSALELHEDRLRLAKTLYRPLIASASVGGAVDRHMGEFELRQRLHELGAEAELGRQYREMPIHYQLLRNAKSHPFERNYLDALDKGSTNLEMVLKGFILSRKWRKLFSSDERYIGVMLPNCVNMAATLFSVMMADRIPAIVNFTSGVASRNAALNKAGVRHIITSAKFLEKLNLPREDSMIILEEVASGVTLKDKLSGLLAFLLPRRIFARLFFPESWYDVERTALVLFSSGSSGTPKAVPLTHRNVNSDFYSFFRVVNWSRSDVLLGNLPLFHAYGMNVGFWVPTMARTKIIYLMNPLDAVLTGKAVEHHKVTLMMATPTFLQTYMRRCTREQFASLRLVITGGEKLRRDIAEKFHDMCGLSIVEGYGCTELSPIVSINLASVSSRLGREAGKPGSIGVPMPGVFVRITEPESGRMCEPGEPGLLMVKGGLVMKGYLNDPENTQQVLKDGFYNTGDVAEMDKLGYITITGRLSRFSKISGEMVPHELVELKLNELLESDGRVLAVTGAPDAKKGEKLVVFHSLPWLDIDALSEGLRRAELPNLWIPRREDYHYIEAIPMLGSGKIDLQKLKDLALRNA